MSRLIKLTPECMEECKTEFMKIIANAKFADGKITFSKTIGTVNRKAQVLFTEMAWLKMTNLIDEFEKEVAWHGIAVRGEEPDTYCIKDILVYPQEVTGATVTTDQEKYSMWLMQQPDEIFNNIRMQGHSHVRMSTSPSSVDTTWYEQILDQMKDDMFYIFMIWNKRREKTIKIYDLRENVLFETADVEVKVIHEDGGIMKFMDSAKEMVVETHTSYGAYGNGYGYNYGGYNYGGYYGRGQNGYGSYGGSTKKEEKKKTEPAKTKDEKAKLRKGKRSKGETSKQMKMADYYS